MVSQLGMDFRKTYLQHALLHHFGLRLITFGRPHVGLEVSEDREIHLNLMKIMKFKLFFSTALDFSFGKRVSPQSQIRHFVR